MSLVKKFLYLFPFLIVTFLVSNCEKKPAQIAFYNIKGVDYVSNRHADAAMEKIEKEKKDLTDVVDVLNDGKTKKPGVIFNVSLGRKIGASSILVQVVDKKNGSVADKQNLDVNPDMDGLSLPYNFRRKGDFLVNFIVKDEIVAQGKIKYE